MTKLNDELERLIFNYLNHGLKIKLKQETDKISVELYLRYPELNDPILISHDSIPAVTTQ